jgi:hypothetical protein
MCFGHFARDLVHNLNFPEAGLLDACTRRFPGSLLAESQVSYLPNCHRIEVGSIVEVGYRVAHSAAETAKRCTQQHARNERCILFAV